MDYSFLAKGHENVRSEHKSTFEITKDSTLSPRGDCIIGVDSEVSLQSLPENIRNAIQTDNKRIELLLETPNGSDKIVGEGSTKFTLSHPTEMVCRKSTFVCSRTLMYKCDKAAIDLDKNLIKDLQEGEDLKVTLRV